MRERDCVMLDNGVRGSITCHWRLVVIEYVDGQPVRRL